MGLGRGGQGAGLGRGAGRRTGERGAGRGTGERGAGRGHGHAQQAGGEACGQCGRKKPGRKWRITPGMRSNTYREINYAFVFDKVYLTPSLNYAKGGAIYIYDCYPDELPWKCLGMNL